MELLFDVMVTASAIGALVQYAWSARGHFKSEAMHRGTKLICASVMACAILIFVLVWVGSQPLLAQLVGVVLMAASYLLFWASIRASREATLLLALDPGNPQSFVSTGPYRYVRHPFYVSYAIFWGGWATASWSILALPSFLLMLFLYIGAAHDEERKFALTDMATDYQNYRLRTGFFLPKLGSFSVKAVLL